ncbi:MAG: four helix bundle protein [bacterium]
MKYERFEDVPVWKDGRNLSIDVFLLTEDRAFRGRGDIANQLQRAALSVPNNVSEGFELGTTEQLLTFLYHARGSAGEVRSILHVMDGLPFFDHLKSQISNLRSKAESISRQIRAWADALQNSEIRGQRYLNDGSRARDEQEKRARAFLDKIKKINEQAAEERRGQRESERNLKSQI